MWSILWNVVILDCFLLWYICNPFQGSVNDGNVVYSIKCSYVFLENFFFSFIFYGKKFLSFLNTELRTSMKSFFSDFSFFNRGLRLLFFHTQNWDCFHHRQSRNNLSEEKKDGGWTKRNSAQFRSHKIVGKFCATFFNLKKHFNLQLNLLF